MSFLDLLFNDSLLEISLYLDLDSVYLLNKNNPSFNLNEFSFYKWRSHFKYNCDLQMYYRKYFFDEFEKYNIITTSPFNRSPQIVSWFPILIDNILSSNINKTLSLNDNKYLCFLKKLYPLLEDLVVDVTSYTFDYSPKIPNFQIIIDLVVQYLDELKSYNIIEQIAKEIIRILDTYAYYSFGFKEKEHDSFYVDGILPVISFLDLNGYENYSYALFWRNVYRWSKQKNTDKYPSYNQECEQNSQLFDKYYTKYKLEENNLSLPLTKTYPPILNEVLKLLENNILNKLDKPFLESNFYLEYYLDLEQFIASLVRDTQGSKPYPDHFIDIINQHLIQNNIDKKYIPWHQLGREIYRCYERYYGEMWIEEMIPFLDMLDKKGETNIAMAIAVQMIMDHLWEDMETFRGECYDLDYVIKELSKYPHIKIKYFDQIKQWVELNENKI